MSLRNIKKSNSKESKEASQVLDPHEEIYEPHEEISDDSEMTGKATPYTYMLVICICVGGFLFGYDTGGMSWAFYFIFLPKFKQLIPKKKNLVISGALSPITQEFGLSTVQQELVVGAGTFGSIFGGFFAGLVSGNF